MVFLYLPECKAKQGLHQHWLVTTICSHQAPSNLTVLNPKLLPLCQAQHKGRWQSEGVGLALAADLQE